MQPQRRIVRTSMFFEDGRQPWLDARPASPEFATPANLGSLLEAELRRIVEASAAGSPPVRSPFNRAVLIGVLSRFRAAPEGRVGVNTYLHFVAPIARRALLSAYAHRAQEREELERWLTRLRSFEPLSAVMVDLHYFAGLSVRDTADVAGVSIETAIQDLRFARSWLAAYRSQPVRKPPW